MSNWRRLTEPIVHHHSEKENVLSDDLLMPNVYSHLISADLCGLEGIGLLIDEMREKPTYRQALLLRAATSLRQRLGELSFEVPVDSQVTLEAQDVVVLMDLLLRRIG